MFSSLLYHLAQEYAQFRMVMSMNLKCYESEIIKPISSNCPSTDLLSTNMSNLHTMTSAQISTQFSELLLGFVKL